MKQLQLSFSAGEIAPVMLGRMDARQYQNGLATCRNFVVRPQGIVERRFGLQNVGASYSNSHASRLIPFVYSNDQAYAVELSNESIRLWRDGETLKWATPVGGKVASFDLSANTVTFTKAHLLNSGTWVRFTMSPGVTSYPPSGAISQATVVDAYTVSFSGLTWLSTGPGTDIYCYRKLNDYDTSYPRRILYAANTTGIVSPNITCPTFASVNSPLAVGDTIRLTTSGTLPGGSGSLIAGLAVDTTYYVISINRGSGTFQVSLTKGGTAVTWIGTGSGTHTLNRHYLQGELVSVDASYGAIAPNYNGVWYANVEVTNAGAWSAIVGSFTVQPSDGTLVIPSPYAATDVSDITYAQSNDVMTFAHPSYAPRELRRLTTTHWDVRTVTFRPTLDAPTGLSAVAHRGQHRCYHREEREHSLGTMGTGTNLWTARFNNGDSFRGLASGSAANTGQPGFEEGTILFMEWAHGSDIYNFPSSGVGDRYIEVTQMHENDIWYCREAGPTGRDGQPLAADDIGSLLVTPTTSANDVTINAYVASALSAREHDYKVTALDSDRMESFPSAAITVNNVLDVEASYTQLTWLAVPGAVRYRIYRDENGVYGFIGESETLTFKDDNITPEMGVTPPIADDSLSGTDYPRAVGYFEQRRCFGGTNLKPRQLWMTRTGSESDLSYTLPVKDTNRISIALAARSAATIRHIVSLQDMLLLTQQGEWRLFAINSDAIGPETVAVRQQSEVGGSSVRPLVVSSSVIYPDVRGGHLRHLSFSPQQQAYSTGDLSLRAVHLFDKYSIRDATFQRSPYPIAWFVSSSGKLLGCTYIPEEEITAWHQHDSPNATFESVVSIPEGDQDTLYAVVVREIGGTSHRRIERIVPDVSVSLEDAVLSDAAITYDGSSSIYTASATLAISGGSSWVAGESVLLSANATTFGASDVGKYIRVTLGEATYVMQVTSWVDAFKVNATLVDALPIAARNGIFSTWAYGVTSLAGLSHLEGETVQVVADGVYIGEKTVSGGAVELDSPAYFAVAGLPYDSDIKTLPQAFPKSEALGQGLAKSLSDVWMRVVDTAGLRIGPDEDNLVPVEELSTQSISSGEVETTIPSEWTQSGQVMVRQTSPLPATILNITIEIAAGE